MTSQNQTATENDEPRYFFADDGAVAYDAHGHVLVRKVGSVGEIILNKPDRLNALDTEMSDAILRAFEEMSYDEALKSVVLRGNGRAFSTGGDVSWLGTQYSSDEDVAAASGKKVRTSQRRRLQHDERAHRTFDAIAHCNKVVIVAAQGYVLGVALDWFLAADIRICEAGTVIGYPPARMIGATGMSTVHWILAMGPALHAEICLLGRYIDADEALDRGLVNRVTPAGELEASVVGATGMIAQMPADGLAIAKYNRKVALDTLGVRNSVLQSAMGHAMQVQQKMEPGDWNIMRERELHGVRGAFKRRDERFREASVQFNPRSR